MPIGTAAEGENGNGLILNQLDPELLALIRAHHDAHAWFVILQKFNDRNTANPLRLTPRPFCLEASSG